MTQRWVCVRKRNANRVKSSWVEMEMFEIPIQIGRFWSVLPPPPLEFRVIKKHSKTINYSTIRYGQSNSIWNHLRVLSSAAHFVYLAFRLFDSGPVKKRNMCAAALSPHKLTSAPSSCICCTERTIFKIFSKTFIKLHSFRENMTAKQKSMFFIS